MATIAVWDIETHPDADEAPDDSCVVQFDLVHDADNHTAVAEEIAEAVEQKWALEEGSVVKFYWHICEGENEYVAPEDEGDE